MVAIAMTISYKKSAISLTAEKDKLKITMSVVTFPAIFSNILSDRSYLIGYRYVRVNLTGLFLHLRGWKAGSPLWSHKCTHINLSSCTSVTAIFHIVKWKLVYPTFANNNFQVINIHFSAADRKGYVLFSSNPFPSGPTVIYNPLYIYSKNPPVLMVP